MLDSSASGGRIQLSTRRARSKRGGRIAAHYPPVKYGILCAILAVAAACNVRSVGPATSELPGDNDDSVEAAFRIAALDVQYVPIRESIPPPFGSADTESALRDAFGAHDVWTFEGDGQPVRVNATYSLTVDEEDPNGTLIVLVVDVSEPGRGTLPRDVVHEGIYRHTTTTLEADPLPLLRADVEALVEAVTLQVSVVRMSEDELAELLQHEAAMVIVDAVRELQRRNSTSSASAIQALLTRDEREVRIVAIGALAQFGARAATPDIIAATDLDDIELVLDVIPALAVLGGSEAGSFLHALATGHESARVRASATRFLQDWNE